MLKEQKYFYKSLGIKALFNSTLDNKKKSNTNYFVNQLMHYVTDTGILFVHVPKAAGTSITASLYDRKDWCHLAYSDYKSIFDPNIFDKLTKLTFLRHPYSRCISSFDYLQKSSLKYDTIRFGEKLISQVIHLRLGLNT